MLLRRSATAALVVLALTGCGSEEAEKPQSSADTQSDIGDVPDRDLFASNVKYELLDTLINRGAEAPVLNDVSCTWSSSTVADCSTTGYDNAPELSKCGYALLPCGSFEADVHAECADSRGHDCQLEVELRATDG